MKENLENNGVNRLKISERTKRRIIAALFIFVFVPTIIAFGLLQWEDRHYYIVSFIIILLALIPFAMVFEKRRPKTRELVLIAVMTAIAVAGRAAFYMLPQFKPIVAIVIITGISLGSEAGFASGALTAFVSNMFFGQGPWTPWQMFALGSIGFISGFVFKKGIKSKTDLILLCAYGGAVTFVIYGVIMDTSSLFMMSQRISWQALFAMFASGASFNLLHAVSTAIFLLVLAKPVLNKLKRIKLKYGLIE